MIIEYFYIENWNYGMFFRNLAPVHRHTVLIKSRFVLRRIRKYNWKWVYNAVFIVGVRVSIGLRIIYFQGWRYIPAYWFNIQYLYGWWFWNVLFYIAILDPTVYTDPCPVPDEITDTVYH